MAGVPKWLADPGKILIFLGGLQIIVLGLYMTRLYWLHKIKTTNIS